MEIKIKIKAKDRKTMLFRLNEAKARVCGLTDKELNRQVMTILCPNPSEDSGDWSIRLIEKEEACF